MCQRSRLQPFVILVILVYLFAGAVWAAQAGASAPEEVAAKVVAQRGEVVAVDAAGDQRSLSPGAPIGVSDIIRTGPQSRVQLMFGDNTIVSLGGNAEMEVSRYRWDNQQGELSTQINQGAFRVMGGAIARTSPENFTTETPSATIGIRGSMYAGRVSNGMLTVVFQGGTGITITNPAGTVEISTPGMGTRVRSRTEPPEAPTPFGEEELSGIEDEEVAEATEEEAASAEEGTTAATDEWEEDTAPVEAEPVPVAAETGAVAAEVATETATTSSQGKITEQLTEGDGWSGWALGVWHSYESGDSGVELVDLSNYWPEYEESEEYEVPPSSGGPYTGPHWEQGEDPDGAWGVGFEDRGEFVVAMNYWDDGFSRDGWLAFYGLETLTSQMPETGGAKYDGFYLAADLEDAYSDSDIGDFSFLVNWRTGGVVGYFFDDKTDLGDTPVYFHGRVSGSGLTDVRILGTDHYYDQDYGFISGTSIFSSFYGAEYQGFGMTGEGSSRSINDPLTKFDDWLALAAAFRDPNYAYVDGTAPSARQGFITARAVNLANPAVGGMVLRSDDRQYFQLNIDRNQGTFSAGIAGGLAAQGIYVSDHAMIGAISGSASALIGLDYGLNDESASYLVANHDSNLELADHVSWGYWAINFDDLATGETYQLDPRGSLWVAGEITPAEYVQGLMGTNLEATYSGGARGVSIFNNEITALTNGATELTINFGNAAATVGGTISFAEASLSLFGSVTTAGFSAEITNMVGSADGAFFGPNAESIGGNFLAHDLDVQYLGIFGGDRGGWQEVGPLQ